jgi:hypothetical protein
MADFKVFSMRDERVHVFRHEAPGRWKHYSRLRWEKHAVEREEDNRSWSMGEVEAYIAAVRAPVEIITDAEIEWVKNGLKKGYEGKDAIEPNPDPNHVNHKKHDPYEWFICSECQKQFPFTERKRYSWETKSYCLACWEKRTEGPYGGH